MIIRDATASGRPYVSPVWLLGISQVAWWRVPVPATLTLRELHGTADLLAFGMASGRSGPHPAACPPAARRALHAMRHLKKHRHTCHAVTNKPREILPNGTFFLTIFDRRAISHAT
jgi:hypothetical protein